MKAKKIIMIILLVLIIAGIGAALMDINNRSEQKLSEASNTAGNTTETTGSTTTSTVTLEGNIRKGTQKVESDLNNILEVTDNFFIEQTNDMYYNLEDYLGKTIKIQGLISIYQDSNGDICYAVVRNTPGCCGADGLAGLDIRYDGEYPELNTWVEVVGVMGKDIVYDSDIPAIQVTSLKETETGTTFVTN